MLTKMVLFQLIHKVENFLIDEMKRNRLCRAFVFSVATDQYSLKIVQQVRSQWLDLQAGYYTDFIG